MFTIFKATFNFDAVSSSKQEYLYAFFLFFDLQWLLIVKFHLHPRFTFKCFCKPKATRMCLELFLFCCVSKLNSWPAKLWQLMQVQFKETVPASVSASPVLGVISVLAVSAEICIGQPHLPWFKVQAFSLNQNQQCYTSDWLWDEYWKCWISTWLTINWRASTHIATF